MSAGLANVVSMVVAISTNVVSTSANVVSTSTNAVSTSTNVVSMVVVISKFWAGLVGKFYCSAGLGSGHGQTARCVGMIVGPPD